MKNTSTAHMDDIADSMYRDAGMYTQAAAVAQLARERDALLTALRALSRVVAQTDTQGLCRTEWLSAQIAIAACEVQS